MSKVLVIIKSPGIGDLCILSKYIQEISKYSSSEVSVLAQQNTRAHEILKNDPHVKEVIELDKKGFFKTIKKIKPKKFDQSYIYSDSIRLYLISKLSGIKHTFHYNFFSKTGKNFFTTATNSITDMLDHYFFLARTSRENDRLLLEVDLLSKKNNELLERNKFLERSATLTEFIGEDERPFIVAKVIGYDATQWSKVIFINRGTDHKVEKNLSVVTDAGVVGHVIHASLKSSKVLLITDSRSAVDSLFQETRKSGITVVFNRCMLAEHRRLGL